MKFDEKDVYLLSARNLNYFLQITLWHLRVIGIWYLLTVSPWLTHWGYENKGNDQLKNLLIVKWILFVSSEMYQENTKENMYSDIRVQRVKQ